MKRYLFDIETNGLLWQLTRCWIVYILDLDTGKKTYYLEGDMGWAAHIQDADLVVGHNIIDFDLRALFKLFRIRLKKSCKIYDTMILSQVLNYKRFGNEGHSMAVWGEHLGYPKLESPDFSQYSPKMLTYAKRDIDLNEVIYGVVVKEFQALVKKTPSLKHYVKAEHATALWCAKASYAGWPFDTEAAIELYHELAGKLHETTQILESKLGRKTRPKDMVKGVVDVKEPKWNANGDYNHHTAKWFGIDPETGMTDEQLVEGDYCRVEFPHLKLSSSQDVKIFLFRNGWKPTQYNFKQNPVTLQKEKTSPKITEDSLEFLGGDGKLYMEYLTIASRYGILKTWLSNVDANDNLHGDCFPIGTPSMRARHRIIVNVPSGDSLYGPEMRRLFGCKKGWKLVGCDSKGNQARGLAHYLNNPEFTDILLNDDIHIYNSRKIKEVLGNMGIDWDQYMVMHKIAVADEEHTLEEAIQTKQRGVAKRILYAFLFGASGEKLWGYIFGTPEKNKGNLFKKGFTAAIPGFKDLLDNLEKIYTQTSAYGEGYIPSIAGTRIYVDSFHKLLVYLLQSLEKITCASAIMLTMERLEEERIPYIPCIFMHDEFQVQVPEEYAERVREIGIKAFQEGPRLFGVNIMDGDAKIGNNWMETH